MSLGKYVAKLKGLESSQEISDVSALYFLLELNNVQAGVASPTIDLLIDLATADGDTAALGLLNVAKASAQAVTATNLGTPSTSVKRDSSGNAEIAGLNDAVHVASVNVAMRTLDGVTGATVASWSNGLKSLAGTTGARPVGLVAGDVGVQYFDTTLNKPIWWKGAVWIDATGTTV